MLEYFESSAKDVLEILMLEALKNSERFEKEVQEVTNLSKEISNKSKK